MYCFSHAEPDTDRSQATNNLLANVSMDSEMNASFSSGSIDLGDLDASPRLMTDRSHVDTSIDQSHSGNVISFSLQNKKGTPFPTKQSLTGPEQSLELESVNSRAVSRDGYGESVNKGGYISEDFGKSREDNLEPLMPARLKPAKEKINSHTKEEERDETPRRKTPSPPKLKKKVVIDPKLAVINNSSGINESENNFGVQQSQDVLRCDTSLLPGNQQLLEPEGKKYEAFFVRGSVTDSEGMLTHRSDVTVAESYVLDDARTPHTPEDARAAGIPVIDDMGMLPRQLSREGSVASSKSSGDFSDHESHKIHADHKTQESVNKLNSNGDVQRLNDFNDPSRFIMQKPVIMSRTPKTVDMSSKGHATSFSQIKHMKQLGQMDNSGFVYMQHGKDEPGKTSLKETFQRKQQEKQTASGSVPTQQGWQQTTPAAPASQTEDAGSSAANGAVSQELLKIKMKLEEKRKAIERKKQTQEIQQQKMRQRLGKAAFLHVVAKPKDDTSVSGGPDSENVPARMTSSDPEVPVLPPSPDSRSTSSASPLRSPTHQKMSRTRGDIQQTIENVKKNWFNDEDLVAPKTSNRSESPESYVMQNGGDTGAPEPNGGQTSARPIFDRRSTSVERVSSLGEQMRSEREQSPQQGYGRRSVSTERTVPSQAQPQTGFPQGRQTVIQDQVQGQPVHTDRRSSSVERTSRPDSRRSSGQRRERSESYDEYSNSLDKLNQSLTDLQGEIMKLSLKQGGRGQDVSRSRSKSPPRVLPVRQTVVPSREERETQMSRSDRGQPSHSQGQNQGRSASEPRQLAPEEEGPSQQIGGYQSQTLPRPLNYQQGQMSQFMMQNQAQIAGPTGPVYGTPSQYIPPPGQAGMVPTTQQYGSYILGPGTSPQLGPMPHQHIAQQPFQPSPPQVYPAPSVPGMYPNQPQPYTGQPLVSPQAAQPFTTVYASPPSSQFSPSPHLAGTYTTSSHPPHYAAPASQAMQFEPINPQQQQIYLQQQFPQTGSQPAIAQTAQTGSSDISQNRIVDSKPNLNIDTRRQTVETAGSFNDTNVHTDTTDAVQNTVKEKSGFFVEMNDGSPRRLKSKPVLTDKTSAKTESAPVSASEQYGSSVIADFAKEYNKKQVPEPEKPEPVSVAMQQGQMVARQQEQIPVASQQKEPAVTMATSDTSTSSHPDTSAVGFVIGQDETSLDQVIFHHLLYTCIYYKGSSSFVTS